MIDQGMTTLPAKGSTVSTLIQTWDLERRHILFATPFLSHCSHHVPPHFSRHQPFISRMPACNCCWCHLGLSPSISDVFLYLSCFSFPFSFFFFFLFVLLPFLGPLLWHTEVPRLGVQSELQPPAYTRATAMQDPSCIYNLHHSSRQRQILKPLSKTRDRTRNLMVPSRIH